MTDRYAVFGNPIGHSRSPQIHTLFAAATHQDLTYEAILAPIGGFADELTRQIALGLRGANVTVPFKEEAVLVASRLTDRAARAGAVNTLAFSAAETLGDNTDGAGLVRDLVANLSQNISGRRILLLGAGGAARGVLAPLLSEGPASICIANRSPDKARQLALRFSDLGQVDGGGVGLLAGRQFDLVINATSASLGGELPAITADVFSANALAYDMMYQAGDTPFMALARAAGVGRCADGLGMLIEQAAEAFFVWRGVRPDTQPVLDEMRRRLNPGS